MVDKGRLACDPRGLIFEAYRIDGVTSEDCRTIFFDWALGVPAGEDMTSHIKEFLNEYDDPNHPMTAVLHEGLRETLTPKSRRGGRAARLKPNL